MRRLLALIVAILIVGMLSSCKDITDSFRPEAFGKTAEELAMLEALRERYGDLTESGEPRFLEAMMTTAVDNFIPVDIVSSFADTTEKIIVWFVYDNFDNDELEIQWIYEDEQHLIHTFHSTTGEDFGRGAFILEQPEGGWPMGDYRVEIRGRGTKVSVPFKVANQTVAVPLSMEKGRVILPVVAGWYLIREEAIISDRDVKASGPIPVTQAGVPGTMYDYLEGQFGINEFSLSVRRTENGKTIFAGTAQEASGSVVIQWEAPPGFIAPGDLVSLKVSRTLGRTWGIQALSALFLPVDVLPGYSSPGSPYFISRGGRSGITDNYDDVITMERGARTGRTPGEEQAILLSFGSGYGYRYVYQWRE